MIKEKWDILLKKSKNQNTDIETQTKKTNNNLPLCLINNDDDNDNLNVWNNINSWCDVCLKLNEDIDIVDRIMKTE